MYHFYFGTHIVHHCYVYTKLIKSAKKSKIKDFNIPRNKPLIVLGYWWNNIQEGFHLRNPANINPSDSYTAQDGTSFIFTMVKRVNYMEQVVIRRKEKFVYSENERVKESIRIDQLIQENI